MSEISRPSIEVHIEHLLHPAGITEERGDIFNSTWIWDRPRALILVDFPPTEVDPEKVRWRIPEQMFVDYLDTGRDVSNKENTVHFYTLILPSKTRPISDWHNRYGKERLARTMGIQLNGTLDGEPATIHLAVEPKKLKKIRRIIGGVALLNKNEPENPRK